MADDDPRIDWGPGEWLAEVNRLTDRAERAEAQLAEFKQLASDNALRIHQEWYDRRLKAVARAEAAEAQLEKVREWAKNACADRPDIPLDALWHILDTTEGPDEGRDTGLLDYGDEVSPVPDYSTPTEQGKSEGEE